MRSCGILMPVFSLPGKEGIGCFSKEAYNFIDFLAKAGQKYWQILPLGQTSYGDSPYQSFSTFAGNPYFISLQTLTDKKLLKESEWADVDFGGSESDIDYGRLYKVRYDILRTAYKRFKALLDSKDSSGAKGKKAEAVKGYGSFTNKNKEWLHDYAVFMALKDEHDGKSFMEWEDEYRLRDKKAIKSFEKAHSDEIGFYEFLQYEFFTEWKALKKYANKKGVEIIGDIPIYVAADSSDVWTSPSLFQMNAQGRPKAVAGCPPDAFSATGQLWGNPLYDWKAHKASGFKWWILRMKKCMELYDVVRIDHFRGFDEYYSIPAKDKTAENGKWKKGPGYALFKAIHAELGEIKIIAEDLGYVTDTVRALVDKTGYPNMKIIEFAFDGRDSSSKDAAPGSNEYLPFNHTKNSVVYTGTHDNETILGWLDSISKEEYQQVLDYTDSKAKISKKKLTRKLVRMALGSVSEMAIIPIQDYLGLDNSARINTPSTLGTNWRWRVSAGDMDDKLAKRMLKLANIYGRR
ncbi:MAG: 4-alpha-glucanotransferase [Lachnospiraceae bacterium]|nr:4-alpha-glucanotransferase [Lachnospiraceae bacterium]